MRVLNHYQSPNTLAYHEGYAWGHEEIDGLTARIEAEGGSIESLEKALMSIGHALHGLRRIDHDQALGRLHALLNGQSKISERLYARSVRRGEQP